MQISRIEGYIGPKVLGHKQRVTTYFKDGKYIQVGETIEKEQTTFKETIEKGWNYFKRSFESYKNGQKINGSEFSEMIIGEEANKKPIKKFGVIG